LDWIVRFCEGQLQSGEENETVSASLTAICHNVELYLSLPEGSFPGVFCSPFNPRTKRRCKCGPESSSGTESHWTSNSYVWMASCSDPIPGDNLGICGCTG